MTPTLPSNLHYGTSMQVPNSSEHLSLPRSGFNPCVLLLEELDAINMLTDGDNFGYSLFNRVCYVVGHHLEDCDDCTCDS